MQSFAEQSIERFLFSITLRLIIISYLSPFLDIAFVNQYRIKIKTKSALPPTPFLAFCSMYYGLLAAATVAAPAAAERYENRNNVTAGAAALETATAATAAEQQKNDPQAIATAGHSAFVKIVHICSSHIVNGAYLIPLLHNTQIAAKTLHRLTK